jgi:CBS domain-containing protein
MMSVGRICVREVDIAERTENVLRAAQRMFDRDVGTLVVIDHDRRPVGLVTDRDIALRATTTGRDPTTIRVAEIMTVDPQTVTEDTPHRDRALADALDRLPPLGRRRCSRSTRRNLESR